MDQGSPLNQQAVFPEGSPPGSVQLPWQAQSVKIDNPTNQWLHLPAVQDGYVTPAIMGVIIALPGLDAIDVEWAAPPGVNQPDGTSGQRAALRFFGDWMPPSPGVATAVLTTPGRLAPPPPPGPSAAVVALVADTWVQVLPANSARTGMILFNNLTNVVFVSFGASPDAAYFALGPAQSYHSFASKVPSDIVQAFCVGAVGSRPFPAGVAGMAVWEFSG